MTALEPDYGSTTFDPSVTASNFVAPSLPDVQLPQTIATNLNLPSSSTPIPWTPQSTDGLDASAVITNLPNARTAFANKYNRLGPQLANLDPKIRAGLIRVDMQRVNKGQNPLTDAETYAAIVANTTKSAVTKTAEDHSVMGDILGAPGNVLNDARDILKSIPHMPSAIYNEVKALPHFEQKYQENINSGMNPVAALLNSPGIRFIPGSFIAGNIAQGGKGIKTLAEHPLMTFLDALPYGGEAVKATEIGKIAAMEKGGAAYTAAHDTAIAAGASAEDAMAAGEKAAIKGSSLNHPISSVLTKKIIPDGGVDLLTGSRLTPNKLGEGVQALSRTKTGQLFIEAFSRDARHLAGTFNIGDQKINSVRLGKTEVAGFDSTVREAVGLRMERAAEEFKITPERMQQLGDIYQTDRRIIDTLPDNEAAFLHEADRLTNAITDEHLNVSQDMIKIGDEVYDLKTGQRKINLHKKLISRQTKFINDVLPSVRKTITDEVAALNNFNPEGLSAVDLRRLGKLKADARTRVLDIGQTITDAVNGDLSWKEANKKFNAYNQARTSLGMPKSVGADLGVDATTRVGFMGKVHAEVRKLAAAEKLIERSDRIAPARWHHNILEVAKKNAVDHLISYSTDPAEAMRIVTERDYAAHPEFTEKYMNKTILDAEKTWKEMRDAGHDPGWLHRVTPGREGMVIAPKVQSSISSTTASRTRSLLDAKPYNKDITVALDHAATEILHRRVTEESLNSVVQMFGKDEKLLMDYYMGKAREKVAKNPLLDVRYEQEKLMTRDFAKFDPNQYGHTPTGVLGKNPEAIWLPRSVIRNMDRIFNPATHTFLNAIDPVTGIFRTSVLALSPRWHVYNIVGNAMMLMAGEGPGAFRHWREARQLINDAKEGSTYLPDEVHYGFNSAGQELAHDNARWQLGHEQSKVWHSIQNSKPAELAGKIVKKSYDLNAWFDDTTKMMAYLNGEKRALGQGYTPEAARVVAMESIRKVSQFWNEMSPIERNVIRKVFPFYAWTSKIMKFVAQYPMDHPVRAAIMANIARAEMQDQGDGLPENWINTMGVGKVDAQGNQKRINLNGLNPFGDTADLFTLKGFMAGLNPVAQTVLTQMGLESGGSAAFGNMTYDRVTGKLVPKTPGLFETLLGNTIPQSQAALRLLNLDPEYRALLRTNPDAAQRMQASAIGLPTSWRTYNEPEVRIKAELARIDSQKQAWNNALQTGDYSEAEKYPALRDKLAKLKILRDNGYLTAYNPQAGAQGGLAGTVSSVAQQIPWPT